MKKSKYSVYFS